MQGDWGGGMPWIRHASRLGHHKSNGFFLFLQYICRSEGGGRPSVRVCMYKNKKRGASFSLLFPLVVPPFDFLTPIKRNWKLTAARSKVEEEKEKSQFQKCLYTGARDARSIPFSKLEPLSILLCIIFISSRAPLFFFSLFSSSSSFYSSSLTLAWFFWLLYLSAGAITRRRRREAVV